MSVGDRITAMSERLAREASRAGTDSNDVVRLCGVFSAVAEMRAARIRNREHHSVLHTARTVLILIEDCGISDAELLVAAAALETLEPQLLPDASQLPLEPGERTLISDVHAAVESDIAIEELLIAQDAVRLLAVSEKLDHARHLHLGPREAWPGFHEQTCSVFLPIAGRTHPVLFRRLQRWCDMFEQRYLRT